MAVYIDEKKIDKCIDLLQNSDPTGEIQPDTQELLDLEEECYMMGPLIDQKLQLIDQKHTQLEDLNVKIIEAFQLYNTLMKESITKATSLINPNLMMNPMSNTVNSQTQPINYMSAPPSVDQNSISLANQLNSLTLNNPSLMSQNMGLPQQQMPTNQFQNQQFQPQQMPSTASLGGYQMPTQTPGYPTNGLSSLPNSQPTYPNNYVASSSDNMGLNNPNASNVNNFPNQYLTN